MRVGEYKRNPDKYSNESWMTPPVFWQKNLGAEGEGPDRAIDMKMCADV